MKALALILLTISLMHSFAKAQEIVLFGTEELTIKSLYTNTETSDFGPAIFQNKLFFASKSDANSDFYSLHYALIDSIHNKTYKANCKQNKC
jgi:hypothetical protein